MDDSTVNYQKSNISDNNFEQCIKCTICTVYCPVTPVNPDFPGPKQAGPDGERYRLKKPFFYDEALKYCLNCKRCEVVSYFQREDWRHNPVGTHQVQQEIARIA